jgi:hypothetical protein
LEKLLRIEISWKLLIKTLLPVIKIGKIASGFHRVIGIIG